MSMFDDVCKFEEVGGDGAWNCFNMIFLETLRCLQVIGLEEYCPACYCYSISPPGQEQLQAVEDGMQGTWVKLQVTQESYKNKKLILVRARPGSVIEVYIEVHADKWLKMWSIGDKSWTKLKSKQCFRLWFPGSDLQKRINTNSFVLSQSFICFVVSRFLGT